jgi:hypothetical protein
MVPGCGLPRLRERDSENRYHMLKFLAAFLCLKLPIWALPSLSSETSFEDRQLIGAAADVLLFFYFFLEKLVFRWRGSGVCARFRSVSTPC